MRHYPAPPRPHADLAVMAIIRRIAPPPSVAWVVMAVVVIPGGLLLGYLVAIGGC